MNRKNHRKNRRFALIALVMIPIIALLWSFQRDGEATGESSLNEASAQREERDALGAQADVPIGKALATALPSVDQSEKSLPEGEQPEAAIESISEERESVALGAFDLLDLNSQPQRPTLTIVDQAGRRESEIFFHAFSVNLPRYELVPGLYTVQIENAGAFRNVIINADETVVLQLGAFDLRGPNDEPIRTLLRIFEETQSGLIGPLVTDFTTEQTYFTIVPGSYTIQIDGAGSFHNVTIRPGEISRLSLGAFDLRDSNNEVIRPNLTIIDLENNEQISKLFADFTTNLPRYYLVPGTYRLEVEDGATIETVDIKAGEETLLLLP